MIYINKNLAIPLDEVELSAVRSQGAGGQNVNKVSSAIHLRFDIRASSLPDYYKERLLAMSDRRITQQGVIILKAQRFRTQEKNRLDALNRLQDLIQKSGVVQKARKATKPSKNAHRKRLDAKTRRGRIKALRGKVLD